jgi:hypothetical protein
LRPVPGRQPVGRDQLGVDPFPHLAVLLFPRLAAADGYLLSPHGVEVGVGQRAPGRAEQNRTYPLGGGRVLGEEVDQVGASGADDTHQPPVEIEERAARVSGGDPTIGAKTVLRGGDHPPEPDRGQPTRLVSAGVAEFENPVPGPYRRVRLEGGERVRARFGQPQERQVLRPARAQEFGRALPSVGQDYRRQCARFMDGPGVCPDAVSDVEL